MDFSHIVEERIKKAYEDGEFEKLDGMGKPLKLEHLSGIPTELRMAYSVLKNAGYLDEEEQQYRKELLTIEELIRKCNDEDEKIQLTKRLSKKLVEYNAFLAKRRIPTNSSVFKNYQSKIEKRFL